VGRFGTLFGKDVKVILRNRTLLVTLILYPLLMVSILGLVFADPDRPIPVGIVIGTEGNAPVELDAITVSLDTITAEIGRVAHPERFATRAEAEDALRNGRVDAVLVFPDYFLADLLQDFREQATLVVVLDASDPAKSTVAENVIRASVQRFNERIVEYKVAAVVELLDLALDGDNGVQRSNMHFREMLRLLENVRDDPNTAEPLRQRVVRAIDFLRATIGELEQGQETITSIAFPIRTQVSHIDSGVLVARDIVVPAAVALSIFWTGILATASLVVYERESHAQTRLNVTPVGLAQVVASKLVLTATIILLQSFLIVGVAKGLWDIRLDNPALLLVVMVAGAFAAVGLGLLVAGLARDTNGTTLLSVLAIFPMMFLSGLFFPISFMPRIARIVAHVVPLTYAVDGLRGAMLRNYSFADARLDLAVLLLLGTLTLLVGYHRNRKLTRRA
jgi:ABC-type multidrug transport system permease subunit